MIYFPLRLISFLLIFLLCGLPYTSLVLADSTSTAKLNGFNLEDALIPKSEILSGGHPKTVFLLLISPNLSPQNKLTF